MQNYITKSTKNLTEKSTKKSSIDDLSIRLLKLEFKKKKKKKTKKLYKDKMFNALLNAYVLQYKNENFLLDF